MSTQSEKLTAIANAIRAKEGSSDPIVANDFPARIAAIETGIQLPTLTNPAAATDIAKGKQVINQDGEIVTGNVSVSSGYGGRPYIPIFESQDGSDYIGFRATGSDPSSPGGLLMRSPYTLSMFANASDFGNATAADVTTGKTFTSAAGVKVTGTMVRSYLQGFSAQITGNGGNTAWVNYPGQNLPTAIFITAYEGITSGSDLFTLLAFGQYGAYTTSSYRAVIDEVSYGSQKSGVLSITQSGSQINITLPQSSYFGYNTPYLVGGFYTQ